MYKGKIRAALEFGANADDQSGNTTSS